MDAGVPQVLEIDMQTAFGRLKGKMGVPPNPIRLAELAYSFLAMDDRLIGMAVAADRKAGREVSCKRGCTACCRQIVPVSPAEAWMLSDLVKSSPPTLRGAWLDRFRGARERLEAAGFGERYRQSSSSAEEIAAMSMEYQRLDLACPFLAGDACGIYAQRPAICREFLATTPADHCAMPDEKPVRTVPLAAAFTECLSKVSAMAMGGEPQVIPLVLALDWAEENREEGRKRYDPASLMAAMFHFLSDPDGEGR